MASNTRYIMEFKDIRDRDYKIEIYDGLPNTDVNLLKANSSVIIDFARDNIVAATSGSGLTFSFFNDGSLSYDNFYSIGLYDMPVKLYAKDDANTFKSIWNGFINTEVYNEDFSYDYSEITLTANDGIAAANYDKYFNSTELDSEGKVNDYLHRPLKPIMEVIAKCLDSLDITCMYLAADIKADNDYFYNLKVDQTNFIDEDIESMSKREVLNTVLLPFGLSLTITGTNVYIVDNTLLASGSSIILEYFTASGIKDQTKNYAYNPSFPIVYESNDIWFVDANQSLYTTTGIKEFKINTSLYPDPMKVIGYNISEIEHPVTDWQHTYRWGCLASGNDGCGANEDIGGYSFVENDPKITLDSKYNIVLGTDARMSKYVDGKDDDTYNSLKTRLDAGEVEGVNVICGQDIIAPNGDVASTLFTVKGGWIPKGTDSINITMSLMVDSYKYYETVRYVMLYWVIKLGSYYGKETTYNSNLINKWEDTTIQTVLQEVDAGKDTNALGEYLDFTITIIPGDNYGWLDLGIANKVIAAAAGNTWALDGIGEVFIKSINVRVNDKAVNDSDLEYKISGDYDFRDSKSEEINTGSYRPGGILDRGTYINSSNEQEDTFNRVSNSSTGELPELLAQAYLSNYGNYRVGLSCTLESTRYFLMNLSTATNAINNVISQISVFNNADLPGIKLLPISGEFNLCDGTFSGEIEEINISNN